MPYDANDSRWRGKSLSAIARASWQFSCFNKSDPNCEKLETVGLEDITFAKCVRVALDVLSGTHASNVGTATHYYADTIPPPKWARGHMPCAHIGHHLFFEGIA